MKLVIQRVSGASVVSDGVFGGEIGKGFAVFCGVAQGDSEAQADFLASKLLNLRVFEDENGKMNRSVIDIDGELLIISNFTLFADCSHGNRPYFAAAMEPQEANRLYSYFVDKLESLFGKRPVTGVFAADMQVKVENDGPVTIIMDTEEIMKKK
ncbi:MAG: D-tyrosyl-tRNA(Tyr) deacylase [Ruminococcaceae bacterium]|nr:D-tyrosyl-tRNA(Tyr) deacylase [Oscillospiraceae bacterium]